MRAKIKIDYANDSETFNAGGMSTELLTTVQE